MGFGSVIAASSRTGSPWSRSIAVMMALVPLIGPGVMLLNDQLPRAITPDGSLKSDADWVVAKGRICRGASIGGGAVVLPGVVVGEFAMIGAGAVVTKRVPPHRLAYGNPARVHGYVCRCGNRLEESGKGFNPCLNCGFELQASD